MTKKSNILYLYLIVLSVFISIADPGFAQNERNGNILHLAEIPDSIASELDIWYNKQIHREESVGAGWYVRKLGVDFHDTSFNDGVYVFHGPGPHFPWFLFIYYNNRFYIFKHRIDKSVLLSNMLTDFLEAQEQLKFQENEDVIFMKIILDWMHSNLDNIDWYSQEIED